MRQRSIKERQNKKRYGEKKPNNKQNMCLPRRFRCSIYVHILSAYSIHFRALSNAFSTPSGFSINICSMSYSLSSELWNSPETTQAIDFTEPSRNVCTLYIFHQTETYNGMLTNLKVLQRMNPSNWRTTRSINRFWKQFKLSTLS